ncbi:aspartyl protease family protein [Flectobacillus roseus]|uniref:aspartyl protease family protein n=1 Tax=Flectobacillus roseus TaxID=502259 RepID=UPI003636724A
MNRPLIFCFFSLLILNIFSCFGQENSVYEIPFSTEKKLLVFKGKLNGVETDFAFDTGAAEGIATTKDEHRNGVSRTNSSQQIIDGNGKLTRLQTVFTKELSIGGFTFENVRASINDMQYLYCMNLYLLGADIIRKLNWEFDFEKMVLKVSKNSFAVTENMTVIPVIYEYNTPRTKLTLDGVVFKDVLIDIGFTGSMTIPITDKKIQNFLEIKRQLGQVSSQLASSFAAAGMSKPSLTETVMIDSLSIDNHLFKEIEADFKANTDFKIGLGFFTATCDKVIINNSQKKYYLQLKNKSTFKSKFPVSVLLVDGKLRVSYVTLSDNVINNNFTINEEVKSINGKRASDFVDECHFLNWFYLTKWEKLIIQKTNGETVEVLRSLNSNQK